MIWSSCFLQKVAGSTVAVISATVPPRSPWPFWTFDKKDSWMFDCFLFTLLDFILTQAHASTSCGKPSQLKLNSNRYGCVAGWGLCSHFDGTHHSSRCVWCSQTHWRGLTHDLVGFLKVPQMGSESYSFQLDGFSRKPFPITQASVWFKYNRVCVCVQTRTCFVLEIGW